jgi:hypothetical protein
MAFRRQKQAENELADFLPAFKAAVLQAHKRLLKNPDIADLDKGTRSRIVRDFVVAELRRQLDGQRGVHIEDGNQTVLFCLRNDWLVQVHKLDETGGVAKNFTQLSMDLRSNTIDQGALPNIPPAATVLFLGPVDTGDIEHPDVWLVCPGVGSETWKIDLTGDDEEPPAIKEITPEPPPTDQPGTQVVVKPSRRRQRKL